MVYYAYTMAEKSRSTNNLLFIGGVVLAGVIVASGAIMFGRSDAGQIDVSAAIANSNAQAQERGEQTVPQVPRNPHADLPNGGLIGKDASAQPSAPQAVQGAATSSDEAVEDSEEEAEEEAEETIEEDEEATEAAEDTEPVEEESEETAADTDDTEESAIE